MGREAGAKKAIKICLCYSLIFSTVFATTLFFCADFIGTLWLGDTRTILSLRILALSLPFLAICAVMGGYFTAVRRVLKLSAVMITEQVFRIAATVACILALLPRGLEYACAGIAIGACIGEIASNSHSLWAEKERRLQRKCPSHLWHHSGHGHTAADVSGRPPVCNFGSYCP